MFRHAALHDLRGVWYPAGRRVHGDEAAAAQRQPRHQRPLQVRGQRRPPEVSTVQYSTVQAPRGALSQVSRQLCTLMIKMLLLCRFQTEESLTEVQVVGKSTNNNNIFNINAVILSQISPSLAQPSEVFPPGKKTT